MKIGATLPVLRKEISQKSINAYADATGDFNPIHVDEAFAASTPFKGTIAHGFYIFGFISELMTRHFGKAWIQDGKIDVRFKKPVKPGDTISVIVTLVARKIENDHVSLEFDAVWENQMKEPVISGKAVVLEKNGNINLKF